MNLQLSFPDPSPFEGSGNETTPCLVPRPTLQSGSGNETMIVDFDYDGAIYVWREGAPLQSLGNPFADT